MADAGDDDVVNPLVGVVTPLARKNADCRAAGRLRSPRGGGHDLVPATSDDGAPPLGEQASNLFGSALVLRSAADHGHLNGHARRC